tara:strand:- start:6016 stop:6807 length:792 start_codon:yes stop_codon:yes gene_type:complete
MSAFRGKRCALWIICQSAFFVVWLFIAGGSARADLRCQPFAPLERVAVTHVYDGDTVKLDDGRKVRLIGINATEPGRDGEPDQPFAAEARDRLRNLIKAASQLHLLTDRQTHDRFGRILAHLFNERGESLEQILLEQGLAYHVAVPPNLTLADCFASAEQLAVEQQRGLWGKAGIPPLVARDVQDGGFKRLQGTVTAVQTGRHWRLVLDDVIKVMIYPEHRHRFEAEQLNSLQGQRVEIQGWVYRSRGEWRVKLETGHGLVVL